MSAFVITLIVVVVVLLFVWRGWRRGLVLTLCACMMFVAAFWGGDMLARKYSTKFSGALSPIMSSLVEKSSRIAIGLEGREAEDEYGNSFTEPPVVPAEFDGSIYSAAKLSFEEMGAAPDVAMSFAEEVSGEVAEVGNEMYMAISDKAAYVVSYIMVFLLGAAVILIAATALANLFNLAVEFPGFNYVSRIGGAVVGLFMGFLVLYGIGWLLRFSGAVMPDAVLGHNAVSRFLENNPFVLLTGL